MDTDPLPCDCGAESTTLALDGAPACAACAARVAADPAAREEHAGALAVEDEIRAERRALAAAVGVGLEGEGAAVRPAPKLPAGLPPDSPAARLAAALALRGVYPHKAGGDAGLSRGAVRWMLEHPAESPRVATLAALARVLRVDPGWLAFGGSYPAPAAEGLDGEQLRAEGVPREDERQGHPLAAVPAPALAPAPSPAEEHGAEGEPPPALEGVEAREEQPPAEPAGGVPPERIREALETHAAPSTGGRYPQGTAEESEALRARWRATPGASQSACEVRTGIAQSTFSRWLSGRVRVGAPATLEAVRAYLDALDAERAAAGASQTALPLAP